MKKLYETKYGPVKVTLLVNSAADVIGAEMQPVDTLVIDGIEVCADVRDTLTFKHQSFWTPGSSEDNVEPEQWAPVMEELDRVKQLALEDKKFNLDARSARLDYAIESVKTLIARETAKLQDLQKVKTEVMIEYVAMEGEEAEK